MNQLPGIYVHIPFCERKCSYCSFNTTDFNADLAARYVRAVSREIETWGHAFAEDYCKCKVDTIYFGGGTPSTIEADQLGQLIRACNDAFEIDDEAEVTIEINPGAISAARAKGWILAGVNRASVGAQSFIDRELISLTRTHSAGATGNTVDILRDAGFRNVSLDLIAGLPRQTHADWEYNLTAALSLRPEHLSLYMLEVKPGTLLHAQLKRELTELPQEDDAARMYQMLCERTADAGYEQYEISNFARAPQPETGLLDLKSKHNLKYWTGAAFYGMGCGAHSYDGRARWHNTLKTETYIEQIETTGGAIAEREQLSDETRAVEALFMALRLTEGIGLEEFRERYGLDALERFRGEFPRLRDAGLIGITDGRLALTSRGRLLSNEVFVSII